MSQTLHPTKIDIPDDARAAMVDLLNDKSLWPVEAHAQSDR